MKKLLLSSCLLALCATAAVAAERQLIVSIAPDWNSTQGKMQLFQKNGSTWTAASAPIPVLFGKSGLAWGIGEHAPQEGIQKREKDGRAPAGLFDIGKIYTYDAALPQGANFPYRTVGKGDAWIDDVSHPQYNQHVVVDPANPPAWFEKQKMRHGDFAYRWLVEVRHNSDPPAAGKGSAIFFHIRRGPTRPSHGCTTMAEANLVKMIQWLRADAHPQYVLLTWADYQRLWKEWKLPPPELVAAKP